MSWISIHVHMVFTTKYREQLFETPSVRKLVFQHMKTNAIEKDIWLDCVGGWTDHAHCLISLGKQQTISDVARLIKGESSYWINKMQLIEKKFFWQDDYWAVGVSESHVSSVRNYIQRQEIHHAEKSFKIEIDNFMQKHGWSLIKGD